MRPIWLPNLKEFATGFAVGSAKCIQVSVENTVPVPVAPSQYSYKERRFHLPAGTGINARTGAWVQLDVNSDVAAGTPGDIANTITELRVSWNGGAALEFGKGANSGAVTAIGAVGAGQSTAIGTALVAGDKVWVRALQNVAVATGELLLLFLG